MVVVVSVFGFFFFFGGPKRQSQLLALFPKCQQTFLTKQNRTSDISVPRISRLAVTFKFASLANSSDPKNHKRSSTACSKAKHANALQVPQQVVTTHSFCGPQLHLAQGRFGRGLTLISLVLLSGPTPAAHAGESLRALDLLDLPDPREKAGAKHTRTHTRPHLCLHQPTKTNEEPTSQPASQVSEQANKYTLMQHKHQKHQLTTSVTPH